VWKKLILIARYAFRIVSLLFIRRTVSRLFTVVERVDSAERRCGRQSPRQVKPASRLCVQYPRTARQRRLVTVSCSTDGRRPREHGQVSFARRQQRLVAVRTVVAERRCAYIYRKRNHYDLAEIQNYRPWRWRRRYSHRNAVNEFRVSLISFFTYWWLARHIRLPSSHQQCVNTPQCISDV